MKTSVSVERLHNGGTEETVYTFPSPTNKVTAVKVKHGKDTAQLIINDKNKIEIFLNGHPLI